MDLASPRSYHTGSNSNRCLTGLQVWQEDRFSLVLLNWRWNQEKITQECRHMVTYIDRNRQVLRTSCIILLKSFHLLQCYSFGCPDRTQLFNKRWKPITIKDLTSFKILVNIADESFPFDELGRENAATHAGFRPHAPSDLTLQSKTHMHIASRTLTCMRPC